MDIRNRSLNILKINHVTDTQVHSIRKRQVCIYVRCVGVGGFSKINFQQI